MPPFKSFKSILLTLSISILLTACECFTPVEPSDHLVAFYPFNGNVNDESGNENHAVLFDATFSTDRNAAPEQALSFNGEDQFIVLPKDFDYPERTICFWFNAFYIPEWNYDDDPNYSLRIIYSSDHPYLDNGLTKVWVTKVNGISKICFHNGGADVVLENSFAINTMEWYFAAVTVTPNSIKYYLDGEQLKARTYPGNIHSTEDYGFYGATIGMGRLLNHRFFDGKIDDVRIYNVELTPQNIKDIYKESEE